MEEWVGRLWHRWIVRAADVEYPQAAVRLEQVQRQVGILYRALGGDPGVEIRSAARARHGARRGLLQRIAGTGTRLPLASLDHATLELPGFCACFPEADLNARLLLWLAGMAAVYRGRGHWLQDNVRAARTLLQRLPGLRPAWNALCAAHLDQRPDPERLPPDEAANERLLRRALLQLEADAEPHPARYPPWPVPMFLLPRDDAGGHGPARREADAETGQNQANGQDLDNPDRHRGRRVEEPDERGGLLAFRLESLFTRAEFAAVDRSQEEDEDADPEDALQDMEEVSVSATPGRPRHRVRFDLDLPPEDADDEVLDGGILVPEWDHRRQRLLPAHCRILVMQSRDAAPTPLPRHLRAASRRIRQQFEALMPERRWQRRQLEGSELDLEAWVELESERSAGEVPAEWPVFRDFRNDQRDLSCLLLADLSLSTDAAADDERKVIDVIREGLFLFAEALATTRDPFAIYGFSSRRRDHVRLQRIKGFEERHGDRVRGRIAAIRPGYYTRMGAAIRHATELLGGQAARERLLLILTDGKPNDLDRYEGRYGLEDTRHAIQSCRAQGIRPFCVSIDRESADYLPWLFGSQGFVHIRRTAELSHKLPLLYARLTG